MKKYILTILVVLFAFVVVGVIFVNVKRSQNNPIKDKLNMLDPNKITGCEIVWYDYDNKCYSYTETDPEKINKIYQSFSHMKLREDIGKAYMGIPLYNIRFIQGGETYRMGAYVADSIITRIDDYRYVAEITNLEKLSEKYDFTELVHEMVEKSKQIEAE